MIPYLKKSRRYGDFIYGLDPACRGVFEAIFLYPVVRAMVVHRIAHYFYRKDHPLLARWVSQRARKRTGIEIYPGASIRENLFIDHGMGVVIGETAQIGNRVYLYRNVTLGGAGNEKEKKRHPTIGDDVLVGIGATILGPVKTGDRYKIGAGALALSGIPPNHTAVGVPTKIVR